MTHPWVFGLASEVFGLASEGPHFPGCPGEVVLALVHDEVVLRPCVCAPLVRLTVDMRAIRDAVGDVG